VKSTTPAPPLFPALVLAAFSTGLLISYSAWGGVAQAALPVPSRGILAPSPEPILDLATTPTEIANVQDVAALREQVNPSRGIALSVPYGDLGPQLLAAGVIDFDALAALYDRAGAPLTDLQVEVLQRGNTGEVVIGPDNAYFLLNFFWAVGLANGNPILTEGPMVERSAGQIERFASTGGWSLATRPVPEIYASLHLIRLTAAQQQRLEDVASAVYRPCCGNPTSFPDCNHGMAMLGILELMASQDASADEMFEAAKYVNAFWFPQAALETAIYLDALQQVDFADADARLVTGATMASGSGAAGIHEALQVSGLLPAEAAGGGNCAN